MRDCFTAGYTLPQFCIDNGFKKPLFVAEKKFWQLVWEIYVQFHYDKRLNARFSFLDADNIAICLPAHAGIIDNLEIKNISTVNPADFDAIIFLTTKRFNLPKAIYLNELTVYFIRKAYVEIPLLSFLQRHPQVKLFLTNYPSIYRYKDGAEFTSQLLGVEEFTECLRADKSGNIKTTLDKFGYTNAQVLEISEPPEVMTKSDGSTAMIDDATKPLHNIQNGKRVTADQPEKFLNRIYFVGQCIYFGVYAPFDKTIESYLQQMLNENNLPYRVENESQFCFGRTQDTFYNLNNLNPAPGDIIFVVIENQSSTGAIPYFDVNGAFDPPHDFREVFCVQGHINELGYKLLAEKFFKFLTANNFFRDVEFSYHMPPPAITDTAYHRNLNRAAQKISSTKNLKLTKKFFARRKFKSARWS